MNFSNGVPLWLVLLLLVVTCSALFLAVKETNALHSVRVNDCLSETVERLEISDGGSVSACLEVTKDFSYCGSFDLDVIQSHRSCR